MHQMVKHFDINLYFQREKHKFRPFKLSGAVLHEYLTNPAFRKLINEKVGVELLDLNVGGMDIDLLNRIPDIKNIFFIDNLQGGIFSANRINLQNMRGARNLNLSNTDITDRELNQSLSLCNIYDLNLSRCQTIKIVSSDVVRNVHTLNLSGCTNISSVNFDSPTLHTLKLNGCNNLSRIYLNGPSLHTLTFSGNKLSDVSILGSINLHTLTLSGDEIKDVRTLGHIHTLDLTGCYNIETGFEQLRSNHELRLVFRSRNFPVDLDCFSNIRILSLKSIGYTRSARIYNLNVLTNVQELKISNMTILESFNRLENLEILRITRCNIKHRGNIKELSTLILLKSVTIKYTAIKKLYKLNGVNELILKLDPENLLDGNKLSRVARIKQLTFRPAVPKDYCPVPGNLFSCEIDTLTIPVTIPCEFEFPINCKSLNVINPKIYDDETEYIYHHSQKFYDILDRIVFGPRLEYLDLSLLDITSNHLPPLSVHSLHLSHTQNITDVHMLDGVRYLYLSNCQGIMDVSMLGNVHTLDLSHCQGITDVRTLGNVRSLNLSHCYGITDVSMLGDVHTLNLSNLHITSVNLHEMIPVRCHTLILSECQNVTDVRMLSGVTILDLHGCQAISDVSMLGDIHNLNLYNCSNITNVSNLGRVYILNLMKTGNGMLRGVGNLDRVNTLYLSDDFVPGEADMDIVVRHGYSGRGLLP
ncbi:MAG: hypothetical protein WCG32_02805 [Actinomycetes bacterium]